MSRTLSTSPQDEVLAHDRALAPEDEIRIADPFTLALLGLTLTLQILSWGNLHGYQLADSVEYIERARGMLYGHEVLGGSSVRSFAFSGCFLPFFHLADKIGVADPRFLVWFFRGAMMLLGLFLVLSCMRIGARLGGRWVGWCAGFFAGSNAIFLQYSVSPVSGIAAALCVSLGIERAVRQRGFRHHLIGGLWFGLAFMFAYQTLLVTGPFLVLLALRDSVRHARSVPGTLTGFGVGFLGQVALDRVSYGEWGSSIYRYVLDNAGGVIVPILRDTLGMEDLARSVYERMLEGYHASPDSPHYTGPLTDGDLQDRLWYFTHLTDMIPVPLIALLLAGGMLALFRPRWTTSMLIVVLAINVFVMSRKGSKSFRLWLPLLPLMMPLAAYALGRVGGILRRFLKADETGARPRLPFALPRRVFAGLLLAASLVLSQFALAENNTRRYGIFWEAIAWVNEQIELDAAAGTLVRADDRPNPPGGYGEGKVRISATYHWSVFMRESPLAHSVKLPRMIDSWDSFDRRPKQRILDTLASVDWFIAHLPALTSYPELMRAVNEMFTVEAAFFTVESARDVGPVFALKRRSPFEQESQIAESRRFFDVVEDFGGELPFGTRKSGQRFAWVDETSGERQEIELAGWSYEPLPGSDHGWINYWWRPITRLSLDWTIVDRLSSPDERVTWQNNHLPAYGCAPRPELEPGELLREGYLLVAGSNLYSLEREFEPLGGAYRRGDLIPVSLWIEIVRGLGSAGEGAGGTAEMIPIDRRSGEPLTLPFGCEPQPDGTRISQDGMMLAGRFLLPRHPDARLADDGRPDPDAP